MSRIKPPPFSYGSILCTSSLLLRAARATRSPGVEEEEEEEWEEVVERLDRLRHQEARAPAPGMAARGRRGRNRWPGTSEIIFFSSKTVLIFCYGVEVWMKCP